MQTVNCTAQLQSSQSSDSVSFRLIPRAPLGSSSATRGVPPTLSVTVGLSPRTGLPSPAVLHSDDCVHLNNALTHLPPSPGAGNRATAAERTPEKRGGLAVGFFLFCFFRVFWVWGGGGGREERKGVKTEGRVRGKQKKRRLVESIAGLCCQRGWSAHASGLWPVSQWGAGGQL